MCFVTMGSIPRPSSWSNRPSEIESGECFLGYGQEFQWDLLGLDRRETSRALAGDHSSPTNGCP